jgi:prepilin-type N-terminal cleavage/methylation domain-containing protein
MPDLIRRSRTDRSGRRRGFTLVELLIALVLTVAVGAAIVKVLATNQRHSSALVQRAALQDNARAIAAILPAELRELNAADGDITAMAATSISIRAPRQLAFICNPPVLGAGLAGLTMTVRSQPFFRVRDFAVNDSAFIFYEGREDNRDDDGWSRARITAVAANNCPDGRPGIRLTINLALVGGQINGVGRITTGSPVRGFEPVTYRSWLAGDGNYYLALQTAAGTEPLVGPLTGNAGLSLAFFDGAGAVTAVPASVREIELRARLTSPRAHYVSSTEVGTVVDSIVTRVSLRNNPRF